MKKTLLFIILLVSCFVFGQTSLKKSAISTAGGSHTNGNTTLIFTIGEIAVQEQTQGNIHLSEGFIGHDIQVLTGIEYYSELQGINVYPNPVLTDLYIELPNNQNYEIRLFDITGKELIRKQSLDKNKSLNLSALPANVYMLVIIDRIHRQIKSIKIQKL